MSSDGSSTAETAALNQQVESLVRESTALADALRSARTTRNVLFLAVVAFVVVVSFVFYGMFKQITEKSFVDALAAEGEKRLQVKQKDYMVHVQQLYENTSPVLTKAFSEQVQKDLPSYFHRVEAERDTLAASLEKRLSKRLETHYTQLLKQHEGVLKQEFPKYKDEKSHERMTKNIDIAVQRMVKQYYIDEMDIQIRQLYAAWDSFPVAELPTKGQPPAADQLVGELIELLRFKLAYSQLALK